MARKKPKTPDVNRNFSTKETIKSFHTIKKKASSPCYTALKLSTSDVKIGENKSVKSSPRSRLPLTPSSSDEACTDVTNGKDQAIPTSLTRKSASGVLKKSSAIGKKSCLFHSGMSVSRRTFGTKSQQSTNNRKPGGRRKAAECVGSYDDSETAISFQGTNWLSSQPHRRSSVGRMKSAADGGKVSDKNSKIKSPALSKLLPVGHGCPLDVSPETLAVAFRNEPRSFADKVFPVKSSDVMTKGRRSSTARASSISMPSPAPPSARSIELFLMMQKKREAFLTKNRNESVLPEVTKPKKKLSSATSVAHKKHTVKKSKHFVGVVKQDSSLAKNCVKRAKNLANPSKQATSPSMDIETMSVDLANKLDSPKRMVSGRPTRTNEQVTHATPVDLSETDISAAVHCVSRTTASHKSSSKPSDDFLICSSTKTSSSRNKGRVIATIITKTDGSTNKSSRENITNTMPNKIENAENETKLSDLPEKSSGSLSKQGAMQLPALSFSNSLVKPVPEAPIQVSTKRRVSDRFKDTCLELITAASKDVRVSDGTSGVSPVEKESTSMAPVRVKREACLNAGLLMSLMNCREMISPKKTKLHQDFKEVLPDNCERGKKDANSSCDDLVIEVKEKVVEEGAGMAVTGRFSRHNSAEFLQSEAFTNTTDKKLSGEVIDVTGESLKKSAGSSASKMKKVKMARERKKNADKVKQNKRQVATKKGDCAVEKKEKDDILFPPLPKRMANLNAQAMLAASRDEWPRKRKCDGPVDFKSPVKDIVRTKKSVESVMGKNEVDSSTVMHETAVVAGVSSNDNQKSKKEKKAKSNFLVKTTESSKPQKLEKQNRSSSTSFVSLPGSVSTITTTTPKSVSKSMPSLNMPGSTRGEILVPYSAGSHQAGGAPTKTKSMKQSKTPVPVTGSQTGICGTTTVTTCLPAFRYTVLASASSLTQPQKPISAANAMSAVRQRKLSSTVSAPVVSKTFTDNRHLTQNQSRFSIPRQPSVAHTNTAGVTFYTPISAHQSYPPNSTGNLSGYGTGANSVSGNNTSNVAGQGPGEFYSGPTVGYMGQYGPYVYVAGTGYVPMTSFNPQMIGAAPRQYKMGSSKSTTYMTPASVGVMQPQQFCQPYQMYNQRQPYQASPGLNTGQQYGFIRPEFPQSFTIVPATQLYAQLGPTGVAGGDMGRQGVATSSPSNGVSPSSSTGSRGVRMSSPKPSEQDGRDETLSVSNVGSTGSRMVGVTSGGASGKKRKSGAALSSSASKPGGTESVAATFVQAGGQGTVNVGGNGQANIVGVGGGNMLGVGGANMMGVGGNMIGGGMFVVPASPSYMQRMNMVNFMQGGNPSAPQYVVLATPQLASQIMGTVPQNTGSSSDSSAVGDHSGSCVIVRPAGVAPTQVCMPALVPPQGVCSVSQASSATCTPGTNSCPERRAVATIAIASNDRSLSQTSCAEALSSVVRSTTAGYSCASSAYETALPVDMAGGSKSGKNQRRMTKCNADLAMSGQSGKNDPPSNKFSQIYPAHLETHSTGSATPAKGSTSSGPVGSAGSTGTIMMVPGQLLVETYQEKELDLSRKTWGGGGEIGGLPSSGSLSSFVGDAGRYVSPAAADLQGKQKKHKLTAVQLPDVLMSTRQPGPSTITFVHRSPGNENYTLPRPQTQSSATQWGSARLSVPFPNHTQLGTVSQHAGRSTLRVGGLSKQVSAASPGTQSGTLRPGYILPLPAQPSSDSIARSTNTELQTAVTIASDVKKVRRKAKDSCTVNSSSMAVQPHVFMTGACTASARMACSKSVSAMSCDVVPCTLGSGTVVDKIQPRIVQNVRSPLKQPGAKGKSSYSTISVSSLRAPGLHARPTYVSILSPSHGQLSAGQQPIRSPVTAVALLGNSLKLGKKLVSTTAGSGKQDALVMGTNAARDAGMGEVVGSRTVACGAPALTSFKRRHDGSMAEGVLKKKRKNTITVESSIGENFKTSPSNKKLPSPAGSGGSMRKDAGGNHSSVGGGGVRKEGGGWSMGILKKTDHEDMVGGSKSDRREGGGSGVVGRRSNEEMGGGRKGAASKKQPRGGESGGGGGHAKWLWHGEPEMKSVFIHVDGPAVETLAYPAICHSDGDVINVRDCVLIKSGMRKKDIPYVAKIYAFWDDKDTGEMMMGVYWYYRLEHTETEQLPKYIRTEVFASRHRDVIPVACIEDRCYVLTLNEFNRYKAMVKREESGRAGVDFYNISPMPRNAPLLDTSTPVDAGLGGGTKGIVKGVGVATEVGGVGAVGISRRLPPTNVDQETVLLCRHIYDVKLKRILKNPQIHINTSAVSGVN